jgi:hypothetical protein
MTAATMSKRKAYIGSKARIKMLHLDGENTYLQKIKEKLLHWAVPGGHALGKRL